LHENGLNADIFSRRRYDNENAYKPGPNIEMKLKFTTRTGDATETVRGRGLACERLETAIGQSLLHTDAYVIKDN
jgi:hypothetical protein